MGATVSVRTVQKRIVLRSKLTNRTVELTQGVASIKVNGALKPINRAPAIKGGTLFMPVQTLSLGFNVSVATSTANGFHTIRIMQPKSQNQTSNPTVKPQRLDITGDNFSFDQATYKVKAGQPVQVSFRSEIGVHGIAIVGADVSLNDGVSQLVTLIAGVYWIVCSIPCGAGHSQMISKLVVS